MTTKQDITSMHPHQRILIHLSTNYLTMHVFLMNHKAEVISISRHLLQKVPFSWMWTRKTWKNGCKITFHHMIHYTRWEKLIQPEVTSEHFPHSHLAAHISQHIHNLKLCRTLSKSLYNTSLLHSDLLSQYNFIDVLTCCLPPFRVKSRALDVLPSLPALPTAWTYVSTSSQAPKCMFRMSWMSTPIPNAMVAITIQRGDTVEKFLIMQSLIHGSVKHVNYSIATQILWAVGNGEVVS